MKVKANFDYKDTKLDCLVKKDEIIEVDEERAKVLTTHTFNSIPFCSVVEEPKEAIEEPKKKTRKKD